MLKSVGTYSIASGRPESVRFTEVSTKQIRRLAESVGLNEDKTETKIIETPSVDYFDALNLLLDFVIETAGFQSKWTAAEVEALKVFWDWNDRDEEWFYSISVEIKKPAQSQDEEIPLIIPFKLPKIRDKQLPNEVKGYLNTIYDEAWLYIKGKFEGGTQGNLLDGATAATSANAEPDNNVEDEELEDEMIDDSDTVKEPVLA